MTRDHSRMHTTLTRRRLLGSSAGGFAAAMLAGGALPAGFGKVVVAQDGGTEFHSAWPYLDPGAGGHFNQFVTNGIMNPPNIYGDLMWIPMGLLIWVNNEWLPLLATEWRYIRTGEGGATPAASPVASPADAAEATPATGPNGGQIVSTGIDPDADTFQVRLRQGVMWSDGTPVTSRDVVDTFDILRLQSNTVWDYLSGVEALDDTTINFYMSVPSTVVERYVIRRSPLPSAIYGEWAQRTRDLVAAGATPEDQEWVRANEELNQFRPEQIIVNGPYTIDIPSVTNAQFNMPKNESSFWADQAKFDRIVNFNGETDTISAVVLSGDIDYATHGFPPATDQQMVEQGLRILRAPTYGGISLIINYGALPHFADKRVRQALAHAIRRDEVATVSLGESADPSVYMTGMSDRLVTQWLSETDQESLNGYEYDPERAAALLEEAGWTKDGDTWLDPDGNVAEYEITFPAELANQAATGTNVAEQLTAFGIRMNPRAITFTQVTPDIMEGRFQLCTIVSGSTTNPHPHYSYVTAFFTYNARDESDIQRGMDFPLVQETDVAGTVDLEQLVINSAEGLDVEQQRAQVTTIALVFNELLPMIPMYDRLGNNPINEGTRVAPWPPDDDPVMQNAPYADGIPTILMLTGRLEPVTG